MSVISKVISTTKRERRFVEETILGGVVLPLCKMNDYDIYVYYAECG